MSNQYQEIKFPSTFTKLPDGYSVVWFDDRMWAKYHDELLISRCCRFSLRRFCFRHFDENRGHLWVRKAFFENDLTQVCQLCGIVKRADGQNSQCVGKVKITTR